MDLPTTMRQVKQFSLPTRSNPMRELEAQDDDINSCDSGFRSSHGGSATRASRDSTPVPLLLSILTALLVFGAPVAAQTVNCEFTWGDWTGDCATENSVQTRKPITTRNASGGGKECPQEEEEACPILPCEFDGWGDWQNCSEVPNSEFGKRVRYPNIKKNASGGGASCPQNETERCPIYRPPANCSSIQNINNFCSGAGGNGLIDDNEIQECYSYECKKDVDAALCCKPDTNAKKCNTIENPTDFCASYGAKGLVEFPEFRSCKTTQCSSQLDGPTCCKHADCSSILNETAFCADAGNNGLIDEPETVSCLHSNCTISADAERCCKSATEAESCDSIKIDGEPNIAPADFCAKLGGLGLVENPENIKCARYPCTIEADLHRCCKPCPAGKYVKRREGGEAGNNTCHACDVGKFAPEGVNICESYCPAGYGKKGDIYLNVMLMLDKTGSIQGEWTNEIDAAKAYLTAFTMKIREYDETENHQPIVFHAGAIAWGTEPVYLNDTNNNDDSRLKRINNGDDWDESELLDILDHSKTSVVPSGGTNYGPPFAMFEKEINERGAGADISEYARNRQLNFGIFLTDGLATDYEPDFSTGGLDYPFSGTYSAPSYYGEDVISEFCDARGWCDSSDVNCINVGGNSGANDCVTANIIHAVKNTPGTTIVGIYVGDQRENGTRVLHNVSSCDIYDFDSENPLACNNTFSAENFESVLATIIPTVDILMLEAQELYGECQVCQTGMYSPANGAKCEPCPAGKWGDPSDLTQCQSCPVGRFSAGKGLQDVSGCWPTCGSLNDTQVGTLCSGDGYTNTRKNDDKLCSGPTCHGDEDRSTCCQCAAGHSPTEVNNRLVCTPTCGSLDETQVNTLCAGDGYTNALKNHLSPCSGPTCQGDKDRSTCCLCEADHIVTEVNNKLECTPTCSSLNADEIAELCEGEDYGSALNPDSFGTPCSGGTCDKSTCCCPKGDCIPVKRDCNFTWGEWTGDCATKGSLLTRKPIIYVSMLNDGRECPVEEKEVCPTLDCIFDEGSWGPCNASKPGAELGTRKKRPNITRHPSGGGRKCPPEIVEQCLVQGSALCSTIKNHKTFCKNAGNNGLNSKNLFKECQGSICKEASDAALCCKPAAAAAECNTIPNPTDFCASYNNNGGLVANAQCQTSTCKPALDGPVCCIPALAKYCDSTSAQFCAKLGGSDKVDNANQVRCAGQTCTTEADLDRCCKCPTGKFAKRHEGGNSSCHACEIGQYAPAGANKCEPYCPAGYGAKDNETIYLNLVLMLDKTGSIQGEWASEIEAAKAYLKAFEKKIRNHSQTIVFHAGAIAWGTEPVYLNDNNNNDDSRLKHIINGDVDELLGILDHSKTSVVPSGGTNYGPPFAMFEKEINERGAGADISEYARNRQLNFGIFLTDGLATDYEPDFSTGGLDYPFSGTYSAPSYYGEDVISEFCDARGWCDSSDVNCINVGGNSGAKDCVTANIIHAVKNTPGTTIVGIYVGDQTEDGPKGPRVLHSVSSCDTFTFDPQNPLACPNTFSAENFESVHATIIPTVDSLMLKAQALRGECRECETGMYSPADGAKCEPCPAGKWGDPSDLTQCQSCPVGRFSAGKGLKDVSGCWPTCGSLNDTQVGTLCSGDGYGNKLNPSSKTTLCGSAICSGNADKELCCLPDAKCSSVVDSARTAFCKDHDGNGLRPDAINITCQDSKCTAENDGKKCCQPNANCSTISGPPMVEEICGPVRQLRTGAGNFECGGPTCTKRDTQCCGPKLCSSVTGTALITLCKNHGGNGLRDNATAELCNDIECTAADDGAKCCEPDAKCSSLIGKPDELKKICPPHTELINNPGSVLCDSKTCTAVDRQCCADTTCKSLQAGRLNEVCGGDKYGNGLKPDPINKHCSGFYCTADDADTCCSESANCSSLSSETDLIQSVCLGFGLIEDADTTYCEGITCGHVDKIKCCKSPALCSSLKTADEVIRVCGEGRHLIDTASRTRCKGVECETRDMDTCCAPLEPCPPKVCTCSHGTAATGEDCIYDKSENCVSCDRHFFLENHRKGLASCISCPKGLCQEYNFFTGPKCGPCPCSDEGVSYYIGAQFQFTGMAANTFNSKAKVKVAFSETVAYLLGVPADSVQNVIAHDGNISNCVDQNDNDDGVKTCEDDDALMYRYTDVGTGISKNCTEVKDNCDDPYIKQICPVTCACLDDRTNTNDCACPGDGTGTHHDSNGVQECDVDYEIAFYSEAERTEKLLDQNELITDSEVFKSVFKAKMRELGEDVANLVDDKFTTSLNAEVNFFTRGVYEEDDADANATAATADARELFSGGTFVGGIALGMSLCAIVGGIVWMRRSHGGIKTKSAKLRAKPSLNSFGLHGGGETELTEITISNKKTTNPAFGHKKNSAAATKKKKRKSQKAKAPKTDAANVGEVDLEIHTDAYGRRYSFNTKTHETKWLADVTSPSQSNAVDTSTDVAKRLTVGEGKEKDKVEELSDAQGRRYSHNHKTGQSTWLQ